MKNKILSLTLGFAVMAATVAAVNCGCAFAEIQPAYQADQPTSGHCGQHDEGAPETSSEENCVCCGIQLGALSLCKLDMGLLQKSSDTFPPNVVLAKQSVPTANKHFLGAARSGKYGARGVPILNSENPLYIVLESFLI